MKQSKILTKVCEVYFSEQNSFGTTRESEAPEVGQFTVGIKPDGENGWFEIDGGENWYAEGGLWFEGKNVVDFDGVFSLPEEVCELLEGAGYNLEEVVA